MKSAHVPSNLVPLEIEKEIFASAFRAAMILEEDPTHRYASDALRVVVSMPTEAFATADHQIVHRALVAVHASNDGTVTTALVIQHLRKVGQLDGRALLVANLVGYGVAPLRGIQRHVDIVKHFASERAEFIAGRNQMTDVLQRPGP